MTCSRRFGAVSDKVMGLRALAALVVKIGVVAVAYYLGARLGLRLAFANRNVTAVWPPTGIAVAALISWGFRIVPGVAIGAFLANLTNGAKPETAALITVGNTLAPIAASLALKYLTGFRRSLQRVRDVLALFFVGGFGAMTISATAGTATLWATHALGDTSIASVWVVWWVGDAIGVMLFAPLLLLAGMLPRVTDRVLERRSEAFALMLITAVTTVAAFNMRILLPYVVIVPMVWAAFRFEQIGAATVTLLVTIIAVAETAAGRGPFSFLSSTENLVSLQTFNATVGLTALLLAAVIHERGRAELALRMSEERYRRLFEQANDLVCIHDLDGNLTYVNAAAERITGYSRDRLVSMKINDLVAPEYARVVTRMITRQIERPSDATTYEIDVVGTNGKRVALEVSTTLVHQDGTPVAAQLIGRDITWRRFAEDRLRQQALHDPVTGLPNRALLQERLEYAVVLARRDDRRLALLLLDIDSFGDVNEAVGHQHGDGVLREIGVRLQGLLREADTVARLGGDEYAILLTSVGDDRAVATVADKLVAEIGVPFDVGDVQLEISASIGIALFPDHADSVETLTQRADIAMYVAKRRGGGAYVTYKPELDRHSIRRHALRTELESALAMQSFVLHFQPKIDMATMGTIGVESLIRWMHPRLGLVSPGEFIPLAEDAGLIQPITTWVIEESLRRCTTWIDAGLDLSVAVNISAPALVDDDLVGRLETALGRSGVPASKLILEITESDVMNEAIHTTLGRIGGLGVRLSVDDFGTGHSSLHQLGRLPVSEIKIDRSFVAGMGANDDHREVVRSVVELGRNLGLVVVAEGVETRETWNRLATLGCDQAQGFLMCKPVPAPALESWMMTPSWTGRVR
jgi:diguanylate cyclase (GGDEF)-like protein/PAS domain S-box-containing protein